MITQYIFRVRYNFVNTEKNQVNEIIVNYVEKINVKLKVNLEKSTQFFVIWNDKLELSSIWTRIQLTVLLYGFIPPKSGR